MVNLFDRIYSIFVSTKQLIMGLFTKDKSSKPEASSKDDSGLRGTYQGRLYVEKSVFYKRPEVQAAIAKLKGSAVIKSQIASENS